MWALGGSEARAARAARDRRFQTLIAPHLDAAFNLAARLTLRPGVAEDMVQDACVAALNGLEDFRGGDARVWLLTIVRRRCFNWMRETRLRAARPLVGEDGDFWEIADPRAPDPEADAIAADSAARLRRLVDALPPSLREALVLREYETLSYQEIATVTGAPIGTVMSRLARARSALAESLLAQNPNREAWR